MGTITKTAQGTFRAQVYVRGIRDSATKPTQREAKLWMTLREIELAEEAKSGPRRTLNQALERYLVEVSSKKEGHHFESLRIRALQRDFPELCEMQLKDITTAELTDWKNTRLKTVTPGTVQRESNLLSNVFQTAHHEWKWPTDMPFKGFRAAGNNPPRDQVWRWQDIKAMCRRMGYVTGEAPQTKSQELAYALLLSLRTTLRSAEVLSLCDARVDLNRRTASVPHKMQYVTKKLKTVPLLPPAVRLMRVLEGRRLSNREHGDDSWFTLTDASRDALFRKYRDQLGLKDLHFHDARGTGGTMLARKMDVLTLSRFMGISDIKLLGEVYYRETAQQIASRLSTPVRRG